MRMVYMFPGQNSRYPQMIDRQRHWNGCERILQEASDVLGRNVSSHYQADNPRIFSHNRDVQIGVFLCAYIIGRQLAEAGIQCEASLGLSLGEYNHLVEIGAMSFASALRLLDARGCAYENGPRGQMVSVFPCDAEQVEQALRATGADSSTDIAIELSSKHFVISGERQAAGRAAAWLEEEAFTQARVIDSLLPMHSRLFQTVADAFQAALEKVEWLPARKAYLPNTDGKFLVDARPADYVDRLYRHVFKTVRWARSLAAAIEHYPGATLVEVGPNCILFNAVGREYKHLTRFRTDDPESTIPELLNTVQKLQEAHHVA